MWHLLFELKSRNYYINESDIDDVFESIYGTIISKIQKLEGKGWGWILESAVDQNINISKENFLAGSRHTKLLKN